MARINIHGLGLEVILGFWPEERVKKQRVIIHVTFDVNEQEAASKDNVDYSVDYEKLTNEITEKVNKTEFNLIETLTRFVLDIVMTQKKITYAKIVVEKPDAPVKGIKGISCEMEAKR